MSHLAPDAAEPLSAEPRGGVSKIERVGVGQVSCIPHVDVLIHLHRTTWRCMLTACRHEHATQMHEHVHCAVRGDRNRHEMTLRSVND